MESLAQSKNSAKADVYHYHPTLITVQWRKGERKRREGRPSRRLTKHQEKLRTPRLL